ncbi:hypothetical protein FB561_1121 [Kribbella amoyensis]|uniref:Integral membrane protein n=1 Tax=Kribbella amoyensis TaxID=996641 RepID=A0A561BMH0_9ACTN|nr:hypothetical protein [Kribbella amoyensis]TWD80049.1 hypothetical protein FB561_1121 [Kribbella amoyensis]
MAEAAERHSRPGEVRSSDTAGAIYGTIASMAVIAAGARDVAVDKLLWVTLATLGVFWVAHVYADTLAHHLRGAKHIDLSAIRRAMAEEWPLVTGPLPGLVFLALGATGLFADDVAIRLALWCGVVQLFGWGISLARRQNWSWQIALTAGALNALLGIAIVVLEVVIH